MEVIKINDMVDRQTAKMRVDATPSGWEVVIREQTKTNPMRSYWHAIINDLARFHGYTPEQMKYMIKEQVLGYEQFKNKRTGKVYNVLKASEKLTKSDYSELILKTEVLAVKTGFDLQNYERLKDERYNKSTD